MSDNNNHFTVDDVELTQNKSRTASQQKTPVSLMVQNTMDQFRDRKKYTSRATNTSNQEQNIGEENNDLAKAANLSGRLEVAKDEKQKKQHRPRRAADVIEDGTPVDDSSKEEEMSKENAATNRRKRKRLVSSGEKTFCRGNPVRACHENELVGLEGDGRCRCAVCSKKSTFFCLDCEQWFCLSTKNDIPGERNVLQFSITTSGRKGNRYKQKSTRETFYAYRSCWNIFHSDVLKKYEASEGESNVVSCKNNPPNNDGPEDYGTNDPEERKSNITNIFAV